LQLSPSILKELRMALSRRKKSAVPAESRSTAPGGGAGAPPKDHQDSLRASAKLTSWQVWGINTRRQTGAQRLAKGPRLCSRVHRQSRVN
jgi:hypothetical protein